MASLLKKARKGSSILIENEHWSIYQFYVSVLALSACLPP
jgi:hypothetical protein